MNTTAVIYARVSSIGDRQNTERQVLDLQDYAAFQKLQVSKVFEEHISGAKRNTERPILLQAIDYCKQHKVSILLVSELSKKEQYKDVVSYLKRGYSVRTIAKLTNKGTSTVQRIKKDFNL